MDPRNIELSILNNYAGPNIALTDQQKFNWLQLIRTPNIGPITFRDLINTYGGSSQALEALPDLLNRNSAKKRRRIASPSNIYRELDRAKALNISLIARGEKNYPKWLGFIDDAPPLIYACGQLDLLHHPIIAIVGSRKASAAGKKITEKFATEFGRHALVVASGLARGIDTVAHRTALLDGTIAVVAGGLNVPYPEENRDLHGQISKQGVIISESPPDMRPRGIDFPRRNRIISGISLAVVIVEATLKSGSLITARLAAEQGRDVFAVPGNPLDPRASGTNRLLQEGAGVACSGNDVWNALQSQIGKMDQIASQIPAQPSALFEQTKNDVPEIKGQARKLVRENLGISPVEIDELIRQTGLTAREVHIILLELELDQRLIRHGQQFVSLVPSG